MKTETSYKGKDGRQYFSYEDLKQADRRYIERMFEKKNKLNLEPYPWEEKRIKVNLNYLNPSSESEQARRQIVVELLLEEASRLERLAMNLNLTKEEFNTQIKKVSELRIEAAKVKSK